jgi:hypothetical protein
MGTYYDLERAIQEAALPADTIQQILEEVRAEFADDEMMYELHVVRALQAEAASRMSREEWRRTQDAKIDRFLAESGMERVVIPPEKVPRIVRRPAPKSAAGR